MTMYMFRKSGRDEVQIAKFEEHMEPDDVYTLKLERKTSKVDRQGRSKTTASTSIRSCNCPAYRKPCKHMTMVEQWQDLLSELDEFLPLVMEDGKWFSPWWYDPEVIEGWGYD